MNKKIKIQYQRDANYRLVPAQGAWIGHCPTGDLVVDFYIERPTTPEEVTIEIEAQTNIVREIDRVGEKQVRQVMNGFVLRPDVAYAIGEWLVNKAKAAGFNPPEKPEKH